MSVKPPEAHLLTASQIAGSQEFPLSHPLNPKSEVYLRRLGETIGLQRAIVTMARVPPGKESFIYHAHKGDEEWLYIVAGRGHHLKNPYDADLVYLMGGERGRVDVGEFPTVGKHVIFTADGIYLADSDKLKRLSFEEWIKKP
jgi:uncharacterized cupin superfamily protein